MKIPFRQGIVRYEPPLFNVNPTTVDLVAAPNTPTIITFADRTQDYLWFEMNSIPDAWSIIPGGVDQWLYWDIDLGTGQRTFGSTLLRPLYGNRAPNQAILPSQAVPIANVVLTGGPGANYFEVVGNLTASLPPSKTFTISGSTNNNGTYTVVLTGSRFIPSANITIIPVNQTIPSNTGTLGSFTTPGSTIQNDQHWFDTQNGVMYVFQATGGPGGGRWIKKIRVFACFLSNGAVPVSVGADGPTLFTGTQIGLNTPVDAGEILFDSETGRPLVRRVNGSEIQFVTSESDLTTPSVFASSLKFNSLTVSAETQEPFAGYMVAEFSDFGKIVHADVNTAGNKPFGLVVENVDTNAFVNVVTSGSVSNPAWNWPTINQFVYCDNTGLLTQTPAFVDQVPVGVVLDKSTIYFGIPPGYVRPGGGPPGSGTVTSIDASGGTTGLIFTGGPITTSGTLTLSGTLTASHGGTGLTSLGSPNQVLRVNGSGTALEYATLSGTGTVTSVAASSGNSSITITGSPITTSGTLDLQVNPANVNHNALQNYVANEHINHASVSINAGTGLTGGGDLTTTRVLSLTNTGVTPGSYGNASNVASITVDAQGRITSVTNIPISGGGSGLQRYSLGGGSYVLASGPGVTLNMTPGNAVINGVPGVEIVSASLYVSPANASGTAFIVDFGENEGTGENTSYATMSAPTIQVWNDTAGRGLRATLSANLNTSPNTVQITGLTAGQPFWIKLTF